MQGSITCAGSKRLWVAVTLGLILAVATLLRFGESGDSLWLDELHTSWTIAEGLASIPGRAAMGNYSPTYFYMPWFTTACFGQSEWALRLPSLICGIAIVLLTYTMLLNWTKSYAGSLLAALLVAIEPNARFFAVEARSYACVQLVAMLYAWAIFRLFRAPTRRLRIGAIATAVLLVYLHYTAAAMLVASGIFFCVAWLLLDNVRYRPRDLALDGIIILVCCLPIAAHFFGVFGRRQNWALFIDDQQPITTIITIFSAWQWVAAMAVLTGLTAVWSRPRFGDAVSNVSVKGADTWHVVWLMLWWFVPVTVYWLLTVSGHVPLFHRRYVMASAVAPCMLVGLLCTFSKRVAWRVASGLLIGAFAIYQTGLITSVPQYGWRRQHASEDWRAAVDFLNHIELDKTLPLFVRAGLIEADGLSRVEDRYESQLQGFCLLPIRGIYSLRGDFVRTVPLKFTHAGDLNEEQLGAIIDNHGAWLILRGSPQLTDQVVDQILSKISRSGNNASVVERHEFRRITVARLKCVDPSL